MTIEEFNNMKFCGGMRVLYNGKDYDIVSVDFEEALIGIEEIEGGEDLSWKRCENCILLS
jgi:hypothetical protein